MTALSILGLSLLAGAAETEGTQPGAEPGVFSGFSLSGAEAFRLRYYHVPEKLYQFEDRNILDYVEVVDRLNVTAVNRMFTIGLQADGVALFGNRYILDEELTFERELYSEDLWGPTPDILVVPEKLWVEIRAPRTTWILGDAYTSLGRGLVLNLVRNTDIDIDTSLRGVRGRRVMGDWEVMAVSGLTNPRQVALEYANQNILPDDRHTVTAARIDRYALGPLNFGVQGVLYQLSRQGDPQPNLVEAYGRPLDAEAAGGSIEALGLGGFDFFLEGDWFGYQAEEIPVEQGFAVYGSAAKYVGRLSILAEGKRYKDTEHLNNFSSPSAYELVAGPTLEYERVITEDSSAAVNSNDIYGGRVRVDVNASKRGTLIPYGSVAVFRDLDVAGLHFNSVPETIVHPTAGVQWADGDAHINANAGYRHDQRDQLGNKDAGADQMAHGDLAFAFPVHKEVGAEIAASVIDFHWGTNAIQQTDFRDLSGSLSLHVTDPLMLVAYSDYSSNPLVLSEGNLSENLYGAGEVQWHLSDAAILKAFYGAYRAGIRCAGGQCRYLPGFNGARLTFDTTF